MEKSPLVSIIIPNFNHSQFLIQRLESVFNQTFQNFEVILLDDASTDESVAVLKEYADHPKVSNFVVNKRNSGSPFKQWSKGISLAKGEFIWIAESDDSCKYNFLEKLLDIHREDSQIGIVYCQSNKIDSYGNLTGNWKNQTKDLETNLFSSNFQMDGKKFIEKFLIKKNVIPNVSATLIRTSAWKNIAPLVYFDHMKYNADWYYYLQILCFQKVGFLAQSLNNYRHHNMSVIANARVLDGYKMEIETRKLFINFITENELSNYREIIEADQLIRKELKYLMAFSSRKENKIEAVVSILRYPELIWRLIIRDNPRI